MKFMASEDKVLGLLRRFYPEQILIHSFDDGGW